MHPTKQVMEGLRLRSILGGFALAIVMAAINGYVTLKIGLIEEGTIITAAVFFGVMLMLRQKNVTTQELALVSTMGSAGGSFGFMANFFAAATLIGQPLSWTQMIMLPLATSFFGLLIAVTGRELYVVREPLAWPTSVATKTAISALAGEGGAKQVRILFGCTLIAALYVLSSGGLHWFPEQLTLAIPMIGGMSQIGFACSPLIIAAGYLIGLRVALGFLVGGLVLVAITPFVPGHVAPQRYVWPGVMFLVASGITGLLLNGKMMISALRSLFLAGQAPADEDPRDRIMAPRTYRILLDLSAIFLIDVLHIFFQVSFGLAVVMLAFGGVILNFIATRSAGETAFNPVRVMGILLQGISWLCGAGNASTVLVGAGAAAGPIDQTSLLVQDTVYGRHFGLTARRQWLAQLAVLIPIVLVSAFVFTKMAPRLTGEGALPAPIAHIWANMAELFGGKAELPPFAVPAMWIGGVAGVFWALMDRLATKYKTSWLRYWPHATGLGIGLIIPVTYSMSFFLGAIMLIVLLPRIFKMTDETLNSIAAAGIFGEGAMGLIVAILISLGLLVG